MQAAMGIFLVAAAAAIPLSAAAGLHLSLLPPAGPELTILRLEPGIGAAGSPSFGPPGLALW